MNRKKYIFQNEYHPFPHEAAVMQDLISLLVNCTYIYIFIRSYLFASVVDYDYPCWIISIVLRKNCTLIIVVPRHIHKWHLLYFCYSNHWSHWIHGIIIQTMKTKKISMQEMCCNLFADALAQMQLLDVETCYHIVLIQGLWHTVSDVRHPAFGLLGE